MNRVTHEAVSHASMVKLSQLLDRGPVTIARRGQKLCVSCAGKTYAFTPVADWTKSADFDVLAFDLANAIDWMAEEHGL